jgi:hypothetical protein
MSKYRTSIKSIDDLDDDIRRKMLMLYLNHYDGCTEAQMLADLSDKREAIILYFSSEIVGFTTIQVYEREWLNQQIRIVYSGDTVVDRAHWGQQTLANHWISRIAQIKFERPELPLYWFVIIKGHRTFKYLPTFGKSFYPHWSIDRSDLKPLADHLALDKFGDLYNCKTGIVEYDESQGHLKKEIAHPTKEEMNKESVRFFLSRNPGYLDGHELVCICELEDENMKPFTKRVFRKACNAHTMAETF